MKNTIGRWQFLALLFLALILPVLPAADDPSPDQPEPPLRLKKKEKPAPAEDKKPDKKLEPSRKEGKAKEDNDPDPKDLEQEAKETLARISKNMRASEDRLARKDPGEGTRQIQRDIVKDLDSLIEQTKQQQQQQQQDQSSSSSSSRDRRDRQGGSGKKVPKGQTAQGQKPGPASQAKGGTSNKGGGGGKNAKEEGGKNADLYKDIWGHLPETLRQEMDAYSREKFMVKYSDLLKQYYATLAEKGRKKDSP